MHCESWIKEQKMARLIEHELEALKERVLKMGSQVEDAIRKSIKALTERDRALAIAVIDGDRTVNTCDVEIEEECIRLLPPLSHPPPPPPNHPPPPPPPPHPRHPATRAAGGGGGGRGLGAFAPLRAGARAGEE